MTAIKTEQLTKRYRGESQPALNGLCLEVPENSIFGFLGPNGAGKTTTIKILTALMSANSGYAEVAGIPVISGSPDLRKNIGYLSQEPRMYSWMKARELLCFVGDIFGFSPEERNRRADFLLELSGLQHEANKRISAFSGGMIQRLGIAQALMGKPKVLFLDEPTSALDPIGRKEVLDFIASLSNECTVFMSTHILSDVERVATDVAIISQGSLIVQDKTENLLRKYASGKLEIDFTTADETERFIREFNQSRLNGKIESEMLSITLTPPGTAFDRHEILQFAAEKKFEITRFEWVNATLEDVFIQLVSKKE
ncbi:MAG: ABC transporter ATP-binding protein [Sphingobacteriales bacterium]|nr:ABC transporter ATP-binding protein [Sphingobacteriales bacterium]